ncbi:DNRLRE domain-containing protein [Nocardioides sp. BP30]|uniref:DNRLRE domain-containing protein n=1 Tax=Nocardioides sp. BP30 TaxID=3036374 RepID=UPI0024698808|nr:DNRLRE domain-containing protein [Nocardioides sp. BP30]WGL51871.1 DNRLRE domain-containing protein [Nocardioides sp. BP30]
MRDRLVFTRKTTNSPSNLFGGVRRSALAGIALVVASAYLPAAVTPLTDAAEAAPVVHDAAGKVTTSPDEVSARVNARRQGSRVEITSDRTQYSTAWANPDGTVTVETAISPVRILDDHGSWVPVDYDLVPTADGNYAPKASPVNVVFSGGGDGPAAMATKGAKELSLSFDKKLPVPVISGNSATYKVSTNVDLVLSATAHGMEESYVLANKPANLASLDGLALQIGTSGLKPTTSDSDQPGAVVLNATAGKSRGQTAMTVTAPVIYDAKVDPDGTPVNSITVANTLTPGDTAQNESTSEAAGPTTPGSLNLGITDASGVAPENLKNFLNDPATVYPVTIDPAVNITPSRDTWIRQGDLTSHGGDYNLKFGDVSGDKRRALLNFPLSAVPSGKTIISASLSIFNTVSNSCASQPMLAYPITSLWYATDVWATQPTYTSSYAGSASWSHGYSNSCPNAFGSIDVTSMVRAWYAGTLENDGVMLRASDETADIQDKTFCSHQPDSSAPACNSTGRVPALAVTFNTVPSTPTAPTVTTTSTPSNAGFSTSTTPKLMTTLTDSDGSVHANFTIKQGAAVVWTGSTAAGAQGAASIQVPAGKLIDGGTYSVTATAQDPYVTSAPSAATTFTVDTSPPTTTINAAKYIQGQWDSTGPVADTFTLTGSADTKTFSYTLNGGAPASVSANASGVATFAWTPTKGVNTILATATDKAGNVGKKETFGFGAGPAGMDSLTSDTVSTGSFPIQADGPSGAVRATASWRFSGSTSWIPLVADQVTDDQLIDTETGGAWQGSVVSGTIPGGPESTSNTPQLIWNASAETYVPNEGGAQEKLTAPARLDIRICFIMPGDISKCAIESGAQLVPTAFGGDFPSTDLGPAKVALTTGEMSLSEQDAADASAGIGRTFDSYDSSSLSAGARTDPFGPGWSTTLQAPGDAAATLVDRRDQDRTLVLVTAGNSTQEFAPVSNSDEVSAPTVPIVFKPAGLDDGSRLTLDPTSGGTTTPSAGPWTATLVRAGAGGDGGEITTWTQALTGETAGTWIYESSSASESNSDDPEVVLTATAAGAPTWIAQTDPGDATTCTDAVQEAGCRGLRLAYGTFGSGASAVQRIIRIDRVVADSEHVTVETAASFTYSGSASLLATACGPDPDATDTGNGPLVPLCTAYEYNTTTVEGRTLLSKVTPAGQASWTFTYDAAGRVTRTARVLDSASTDGSGLATWRVLYGLNPAATGVDFSVSNAARWGQTVLPMAAAAVYTPSDDSSTDITRANLWFYDVAGALTNTAVHGNIDPSGSGSGTWLVDTTWYDAYGNASRVLSAAGRARALSSSTDPAQQAAVAELESKFNYYNDDGDADHQDGDGSRIEDEYDPADTSVLKDGTVGLYRAHTTYIYDGAQDGPHSSSSLGGPEKPAYAADENTFGLVVEERRSAADSQMALGSASAEHDVVVTRYGYGPIVSGDGNGWTLGVATTTKTQLADGSWNVETDRYDANGLQIETRSPGGAADQNGAGSDAHSTITIYYGVGSSDPRCDITGHPDRMRWDGLVCIVEAAIQPPGRTTVVRHYASYDADLQPLIVTETAGAATRMTSTTYDRVGRVTRRAVSVSGTGVDVDMRVTTLTYSPTTGLQTESSDAGSTPGSDTSTLATGYDSWGRVVSYADSTGLVSKTHYTADGAVSTFFDGSGTYTYTYDEPSGNSGEHRGLLTAVDAGVVAGADETFAIRYDAAGAVSAVSYPNGLQAVVEHNNSLAVTRLDYVSKNASQPMLSFANAVDIDDRVVTGNSVSSRQGYSYDSIGRLIEVRTWDGSAAGAGAVAGECSVHRYHFTASSERDRTDYFGPASDGSCQTSIAQSSTSATYDDAGRRLDSGYTYDALGRTLTVPAEDLNDVGGSESKATYFADDKVKSLSETPTNPEADTADILVSYGVDPDGRTSTATTTEGGVSTDRVRYQFSDVTDSPSGIEESRDDGTSWIRTRYVKLPGLGTVATVTGDSMTYQLTNIHGDFVATQAAELGSAQIGSYGEYDEFGNPIHSGATRVRYGFLGKDQRATDTPGNALIMMGARVYNPKTGSFLSVDPVPGGNATPYGYPEDPINNTDISGQAKCPSSSYWVGKPIVDYSGFVDVPSAYCYDGGASGSTHDYCTMYPDGYGDVSFKGPCAYHDMCLGYGWGNARSDCDGIFGWELKRNCNWYYDRHKGGPFHDRSGCVRRAQTAHAAVVAKTKTIGKYTRSISVLCYLYWRNGAVTCK